MKETVCKLIKKITFGKVCLGWCAYKIKYYAWQQKAKQYV